VVDAQARFLLPRAVVNAAMRDGSVKGFKETINCETWMALSTRAGGEVVSDGTY
jgi:hypothetical protein